MDDAATLVASDAGLSRAAEALPAPVSVARIEAFVHRYPLETPVVTSFGAMRDRPAVLVRIEDGEGAVGWGEVWCNFPACGPEHRARLVETELAPRLVGRSFAGPGEAFALLEVGLRVLALQTGEWGPLAQCLAGVDIALWDLAARRAGLPLARLLAPGAARDAVPAYASGINARGAEAMVARMRGEGWSAFKVKIGGDAAADLAMLRAVAAGLEPGETLMADANQAWDIDTALDRVAAMDGLALAWLEEPLAADRPLGEWRSLAAACAAPLAAGENLRSAQGLARAAASGCFAVLQPDACKWGGISGCLPAARAILAAGLRYCPHFLGAGVGLVASAHLLAAAGGDGLLEVDANDNPLRETLGHPLPPVRGGVMRLPDAPGLGVAPDLDAARAWLVAH